MVFRDVRIADTESIDDGTVRIGQQMILDAKAISEAPEQSHRIGADGVDLDVFAFKCGMLLLQLDQLRLAEASPGG